MANDTRELKVLLLEDTEADRELLRLACDFDQLPVAWTYMATCAEATTTFQAIAAGDQARPDLVIMDMRLPDGSSTALLPALHELLPGLPVIIFSTSSSPRDREPLATNPSSRYLVKPHNFRGYQEIIQRMRSLSGSDHALVPHQTW